MTRFLAAVLLLGCVASRAGAEPIPDTVRHALGNKSVELRISAARMLGESGNPEAIPLILQAFREESETEARTAYADSLRKLTGIDLGTDYRPWSNWWKTEESRPFRDPLANARRPEGLQSLVTDFMSTMVVAMIIIAFLIIVALSLMGGYKMKQIKELHRRTELAVAASEAVAAKSDTMLADLEGKKQEILQFVASVKSEHESEIERFSSHLEDNVEHRMREVTMTLRQKAEKELEQTLSELKQESLDAVKSLMNDQRDKLFKEFEEREKRFFNEVEAHTIFIEASFHYANHKFEEALKLYKKLVVLKPSHYVAWNNMGTILRHLGRVEEAIESYDKGLKLAPDNAGLLYNKAAAYAQLKKTPEMLELLTRSTRLDPEYKDEALNDEAFKDYWNQAEFKEVAMA